VSSNGNLVTHQNTNLVKLLPFAVQGEQSAHLEITSRDVERVGNLRPFLEVAQSFPFGLAVIDNEEFSSAGHGDAVFVEGIIFMDRTAR